MMEISQKPIKKEDEKRQAESKIMNVEYIIVKNKQFMTNSETCVHVSYCASVESKHKMHFFFMVSLPLLVS